MKWRRDKGPEKMEFEQGVRELWEESYLYPTIGRGSLVENEHKEATCPDEPISPEEDYDE